VVQGFFAFMGEVVGEIERTVDGGQKLMAEIRSSGGGL